VSERHVVLVISLRCPATGDVVLNNPLTSTMRRGPRHMKLLRYGRPGGEKPGILDHAGRVRDLSGVLPDITDIPGA